MAISVVTQYDIEIYQRIEKALGKKLDEFQTDREAVMVFMARVQEAQRVAIREMKAEHEKRGAGGRKGVGVSGGRDKKRGKGRDGMDAEEG